MEIDPQKWDKLFSNQRRNGELCKPQLWGWKDSNKTIPGGWRRQALIIPAGSGRRTLVLNTGHKNIAIEVDNRTKQPARSAEVVKADSQLQPVLRLGLRSKTGTPEEIVNRKDSQLNTGLVQQKDTTEGMSRQDSQCNTGLVQQKDTTEGMSRQDSQCNTGLVQQKDVILEWYNRRMSRQDSQCNTGLVQQKDVILDWYNRRKGVSRQDSQCNTGLVQQKDTTEGMSRQDSQCNTGLVQQKEVLDKKGVRINFDSPYSAHYSLNHTWGGNNGGERSKRGCGNTEGDHTGVATLGGVDNGCDDKAGDHTGWSHWWESVVNKGDNKTDRPWTDVMCRTGPEVGVFGVGGVFGGGQSRSEQLIQMLYIIQTHVTYSHVPFFCLLFVSYSPQSFFPKFSPY
ncbi:hypothetical protein J6590_039888 [Homalodisca vitripennis]|nr:hypothetical protein J6590_039888 [Homalodisca vitripennis]